MGFRYSKKEIELARDLISMRELLIELVLEIEKDPVDFTVRRMSVVRSRSLVALAEEILANEDRLNRRVG